MSKRVLAVLLALICALSLTGCICRHEWSAATCVSPSTCTKCDKTDGEALGHIWTEANCTEARQCSRCGAVEGAPLGHNWVEADCTKAAICSRCALVEGDALGHDWQAATTEAPKTCSRCALTEGEPIVTDPRFKTANVTELLGKWKFDTAIPAHVFGLYRYDQPLRLRFILEFLPDGTFFETAEFIDDAIVMEAFIMNSMEEEYLAMEAQGISRESYDAMVFEQTGMSNYEYTKYFMGDLTLNGILETLWDFTNNGGVYYVEDGALYTGITWESPITPSQYIVDKDSLWIYDLEQELGAGTIFSRMSEN